MNSIPLDVLQTIQTYLDIKDLCRIGCVNQFLRDSSSFSRQWIFLFFQNQNNFFSQYAQITASEAKKNCKDCYIRKIKQSDLGNRIAEHVSQEMKKIKYGDSIRLDLIVFDKEGQYDRIRIDFITPIFFIGKGIYHRKLTSIAVDYSLREDKIPRDLIFSNVSIIKYSGSFLFDNYNIYIKTGLKNLPNQEAIKTAICQQVERLKNQAKFHTYVIIAFFVSTLTMFFLKSY